MIIQKILIEFIVLFSMQTTWNHVTENMTDVVLMMVQQPTERHTLRDHPLAHSEHGRKMLKYLISCALESHIELEITVDNHTYVFNGGMGLAPQWLSSGMNETQQRWVSSCILARTNFFGVPVQILMLTAEQIKKSDGEQDEFNLHEGAFFGNLFADKPKAYVCVGEKSELETRDLEFNLRVCTQNSGKKAESGRALSYCDFEIIGNCDQQFEKITIDGKTYTEILHVYLKPAGAYRIK